MSGDESEDNSSTMENLYGPSSCLSPQNSSLCCSSNSPGRNFLGAWEPRLSSQNSDLISDENSSDSHNFYRKFSSSEDSTEDDSEEFSDSSIDTAGTFPNISVINYPQGQNQNRPLISDPNIVPDNLYQDKCSLKLDSLPAEHKSVLKDLTDKIAYQINYFSIDEKSGSKLKLTCKLCWKTLHVRKVESHVQDQEHLRNLAKRCNVSKTAATDCISEDDWKVLDYIEASQTYLCTLCNEILQGSSSSWTKHFRSSSHRSKLKSSKPRNKSTTSAKLVSMNTANSLSKASLTEIMQPLKDVDKNLVVALVQKLNNAMNDFKPIYKKSKLYFTCKVCKIFLLPKKVESHVQTLEHCQNLNKTLPKPSKAAQKEVIETLSDSFRSKDKKISKKVSRKLKDEMKHFKPMYESDKLYYRCEPCQLKLLPKNVEPHAHTKSHLNNLRQTLSVTKPQVAPNNVNVEKPSTGPQTSFDSSLNRIVESLVEKLNENDKKIILAFGRDLKKIIFSFIWSSQGTDSVVLICNTCKLSLHPKYAKSHFYNCTKIQDSMKNFRFVNIEDLSAKNTKIVKDMCASFNNKLYVFHLLCGSRSDDLYFFCKVCNAILRPGSVKNHFSLSAHLQNLVSNPSRLKFMSLSDENQMIIKNLKGILENKFNFVYKIGTEELRFQCKFCQFVFCPEKVKKHINACELSNTVGAKPVNRDGAATKLASSRESINSATAPPKTTPSYQQASPQSHLHQNLSITNFDLLSERHKKTVRKCVREPDLSLFEFVLTYDSNMTHDNLSLNCKLCDLSLSPETPLVRSHFVSSKHIKNTELNVIFENFLSLESQSRFILRNVFNLVGSKAYAYYFMQNNDNEEPKIKCKICGMTVLLGSANSVWHLKHHLGTENHQQTVIDNIRKGASTSASNLSGASKLIASLEKSVQNVKEESSFFSPSYPNSNLSDHNMSWKDTTVGGASHSLTTDRVTEEDNAPWQETVKRISAKTFESSSKEHVDRNPQHSLPAQPLKPSTPNHNDIMSNVDKQVLKALIDKIGSRIRDFDLVFKSGTNRLRFKCKLCLLEMASKFVETHIGNKNHCTFSQLEGFTALSDRNKNIVKKLYKTVGSEINNYYVKATFNFVCKVCRANLRADDVPDHFLSEEHLKYSSSQSSLDTPAVPQTDGNRISASSSTLPAYEEFSVKSSSQDTSRSPLLMPSCQEDPKFSEKHPEVNEREAPKQEEQRSDKTNPTNTVAGNMTGFGSEIPTVNSEMPAGADARKKKKKKKKKKETPDGWSARYAAGPPFAPEFVESYEEVEEDSVSWEVEPPLGSTDSANATVSGASSTKTEVSVPDVGNTAGSNQSKKESDHYHNSYQGASSSSFNGRKVIPGSIIKGSVLSDPADALPNIDQHSISSLEYRGRAAGKVTLGSSSTARKVRTGIADIEQTSDKFICLPCKRAVFRRQLGVHVHSYEHRTSGRRIRTSEDLSFFHYKSVDYLVNLVIGDLFDTYQETLTNLFEIYHEFEQSLFESGLKEPWFFCQTCKVVVHALSLREHCILLHVLRKTGNNTSSAASDKRNIYGVRTQISHPFHQRLKSFTCMTCACDVPLDQLYWHSMSRRHDCTSNDLVTFTLNQSFDDHKEFVLSLLCGKNNVLEESNFELFQEIKSSELAIFCVPCQKLLEPGELVSHARSDQNTHLRSVAPEVNSLFETANLEEINQSRDQSGNSCSLM